MGPSSEFDGGWGKVLAGGLLLGGFFVDVLHQVLLELGEAFVGVVHHFLRDGLHFLFEFFVLHGMSPACLEE